MRVSVGPVSVYHGVAGRADGVELVQGGVGAGPAVALTVGQDEDAQGGRAAGRIVLGRFLTRENRKV